MKRRALLSVSDKQGIVDLAKVLQQANYEILSTGGTAALLKQHNIPVTDVAAVTGFPEMMDGRVKTLHPKIHGGLLALRENKKHLDEAQQQGIGLIDMVVVNLYPFEKTVAKEYVEMHEAIENIDIGGPSMIRSAAKNYSSVAVVVDPFDYSKIQAEITASGTTSLATREQLARKAFARTANYDAKIHAFFEEKFGEKKRFPETCLLSYDKLMDLRYGANPHQEAAVYKDKSINEDCSITAEQLQGKQLSYNNFLDVDNAFELVKEFDEPTAAVIKHTNPCGVASRSTITEAFHAAYAADSLSAFGGVVALNRPCTKAIAEQMKNVFLEVVIAPGYDPEALGILREKKNLRLLKTKGVERSDKGMDVKTIVGGLLMQSRDLAVLDTHNMKTVTQKEPTPEEIEDMVFAFKVTKHVKSNAVIFVKNKTTVGIGAGQMSRVDSSMIAVRKAGEKAKGAIVCSDAFFPFRDGVDEVAKSGVTAIIQPGGSIRDAEVIQAADEHGIAMVFTGIRLFLH